MQYLHILPKMARSIRISHEVALALASKEYEIFRKIQDENYISDFDKEVWRIREGKHEYN